MEKRLYVTNLPKTATVRDLTRAFSAYGTVESVNITAGSAVVTMSSGGDTAINALDKTEMGGRRISVNFGK